MSSIPDQSTVIFGLRSQIEGLESELRRLRLEYAQSRSECDELKLSLEYSKQESMVGYNHKVKESYPSASRDIV